MALRRTEMYAMTNLIATCGGLLGLFLGISLLSVIEIVAFCAIRLVARLARRRKRKNLSAYQRYRSAQRRGVNILPPVN